MHVFGMPQKQQGEPSVAGVGGNKRDGNISDQRDGGTVEEGTSLRGTLSTP